MKQNDKGQRNAVFGSFQDTVKPNGNGLVAPYISSPAKNAKWYSGIEVTR